MLLGAKIVDRIRFPAVPARSSMQLDRPFFCMSCKSMGKPLGFYFPIPIAAANRFDGPAAGPTGRLPWPPLPSPPPPLARAVARRRRLRRHRPGPQLGRRPQPSPPSPPPPISRVPTARGPNVRISKDNLTEYHLGYLHWISNLDNSGYIWIN